MLHVADGMQAGEGTAITDCHELQQALNHDFVHNLLLSMWDADAPEAGVHEEVPKVDRKTKNRVIAQQARTADKQYQSLMLAELESLTETFEMYTAYIAQLDVHATNAVDGMARLGKMHALNKKKIEMLQQHETVTSVQTLFGMSTKERNRIHAQRSRARRHQYIEDLTKQRDESWSTLQDVMKHAMDLEGTCSVLHDFDDTGYVLLQLTETRQRLLMRTDAHKRKYEELRSRLSYRVMQREKF
jgi:hypothetical protein